MTNKDLQRLHNALLQILDEIDRICRKHNIAYFLDSGTALGAVRHQGFIPWDDDADVGMLREDYERFLKFAAKELGPCFFLQSRDSEPDYAKLNAKVRLNNTYFPEARNDGTSIHQGIFVDVYPFDYISDDKKKAVEETKRSRTLIKLWAVRHRHPKHESIARKCVRLVFRVVPESFLERKCLKHYTKYADTPTSTVTSYTYKMNDNHILHFPLTCMTPSVDILFEGRNYEIMNDADTYLRIMYGEYMKLPSKEYQVSHIKGDIRFE